MFGIKKQRQKQLQDNLVKTNDKKEQLFFHDIINLTHGLILFFNQRQTAKKIINVEEIKLLEKEVRALQSLIKDHFQYRHKNLAQTYDWVPFNIAEIAVKTLLQTYLPEESVQTFIHKSFSEKESSVVYFPIFYRIMNNLIKNMSEAHASEAHLYFNFTEAGLMIETRNKNNSEQNLENISDESCRDMKGFGLESVSQLSEESDGTFEFEISGEYWINRIFLPTPKVLIQEEEPKKAA